MVDSTSLRNELRRFGNAITPQVIADCMALYGRFQVVDSSPSATRIERDIAYGPDDRHRLDIFHGEGTDRPVLVYVHGGGFVGGDKAIPGTPFYGNIGRWAAGLGYVGVNMTYRLAPNAPWPAGAEDVGAAIAWLRTHIAQYGGSPERIFLCGQSAGATHVASYLAMRELHDTTPPVAGALMFSGIYDVTRLHKGPPERSYFGDGDLIAERQSSLSGLIASEVPMLFTVAEHDPETFQKQAAILVEQWFAARQALPRMIYLPDANHMSAALGIGSADRFLASEISAFIERFRRGHL